MSKLSKKNPPLSDINPYIQSLIKKSSDVFWMRSANFLEQIYISPAYEEVWGHSADELYKDATVWNNHVVPEDVERIKKGSILRRLKPSSSDNYHEWYRIKRADGEIRWIVDESFPVFNNEGTHIGFTGIARDVTTEKQREKALLESKEAAESANQAKTEFIANMSHDLKSPLHAILGMAEILQLKKHSPEQTEYLEGIIGSGRVVLKLVNDILNFATIQEGKTDPINIAFNLKTLVEEAVSTITLQAAQKRVSLSLSYSNELDNQFIGDPQSINRILINLLSNAIKYTDEGQINISVQAAELNNDNILLRITVEDTGIGISQEHLPYIFDRFYRTDHSYNSPYKGTGLGLSIARELIKQMNGNIQVTSELGVGSSFNCFISLKLIRLNTKVSETPTPTPNKNQNLVLPKAYKVLLIEDNLFAQKVSKVFLQQMGCKIDLAISADEALQLLESEEYDVIFMDLGLPGQSGIEITKQLRSNPGINQNRPIIGLTAHASAGEEMQCRRAGMNEFIAKPASMQDLYRSIMKVLS